MPPVYVMIKPVSGACNLKCKYCFYADEMVNREVFSYGKMSDETLENIVRRVFEEAEFEAGFAFQGGEPTLAGLSFYERLISLVEKFNRRKLPVQYSIQTNGTLITDEWAKFFTKHNFLVGLSLDGDKEIHDSCRQDQNDKGTFSKVMNAARIMEKYDTQFNILCVVNNFAARHGDKIYRFFKKNGFKYLQFIPCIDPFDMSQPSAYSLSPKRYGTFLCTVFDRYFEDWKNGDYVSIRFFDNLVHLIKSGKAEMCGMSGCCSANFIIESDGGVYPCDFYMLDGYRLGNVKDDSFSSMMQSEIATQFVMQSRHIDEDCKKCRHINICRGGCRRNREPFVDGLPQKNVFCESFLTFYDHALPRLIQMAQSI